MAEIEVSGIKVPELPRNYFDRSRKVIGSYKVGKIYPVEAKILKPNDNVKIKTETVARRLPTLSPSFAEERIIYRWFIVPLRLLYKKFPQWLSGFKEYTDDIPFEEDVPRWNITNPDKTRAGTLWEALGYPVNCIPTEMPADFKRQAYGYVWETFFRYKPIQESILDDGQPGTWTGEDLLDIVVDRDYFTTGLPNQQLGEAVSLPITGDTKAVWSEQDFALHTITNTTQNQSLPKLIGTADPQTQVAEIPLGQGIHEHNYTQYKVSVNGDPGGRGVIVTNQDVDSLTQVLNHNTVSMNNISSATISMIRHAMARQIQAENLARSGIMYTDVLRLNWGDAPSDDILGLPVYIGGNTVQLINSEVLQTSASQEGQPLGQMGGHGMGVGTSDEIIAHAKEFSVLLGVMYIKQENMYGSQQMPEEDMFRNNEEVPWIAYANLSEQPVKCQEILCASKNYIYEEGGVRKLGNADTTAEEYNKKTFMYQPIYEHWRRAYSKTFGLMTQEQIYTDATGTDVKVINNLYNWTQARFFSIKNGERPAFNDDFLKMRDDNRNYSITAGQGIESDNFIIWINLKEDWYSIMDLLGTPGGTDHFGKGGIQI